MAFSDKELAMVNANSFSRYLRGIKELPLLYNFVGDGSGLTTAGSADAAASQPFSPSDVTGLQLWIDADDISTLFQNSTKVTAVTSDGDPVGAWEDKSTNSADATQATGSKRGLYKTGIINSKPVVRFDGVDDLLTFATNVVANEKTIFLVGKLVTSVGASSFAQVYSLKAIVINRFADLFFAGSSTGFANMNWKHQFKASGLSLGSNTKALDTSSHIWTIDYNNGNQTFASSYNAWVDDALQVEIQTPTIARNGGDLGAIGARGNGTIPANFDMAELIAYDSVLSSDDRASVNDYLVSKWGTP